MRVCLCLGCWGTRASGMILCPGCENEILDLTARTGRNIAIAEHLDSIHGLFDRPLYANVHTAVFSIPEKFSEKGNPVFADGMFAAVERFCVMHVRCGLFLRLRIKEQGDGKNRQEA
jgi:hypothetical protein